MAHDPTSLSQKGIYIRTHHQRNQNRPQKSTSQRGENLGQSERMTLAKFQGDWRTIPSFRGEQCCASFKQACQRFCPSMPHIDIPTVSFHQPNKGTLAGLPPGSLWGKFLPALMVVSLRCFHVDAWQRWAPGTFRVDMCAWGQGKIEVIWKLLCFLSL